VDGEVHGGRIPPSTRWWQTVASWQALSRPIATGGGGRRPAFTGLATRPYSGDQVEGGAPSVGRRLPLPVNSIARGKRKWATHQIARSQCHQRACSRSRRPFQAWDLDADAESFRRALATVTGSVSASCARGIAVASNRPGQFQPIHAVFPTAPSFASA
jgi:hypothetical protein